MLATIVIGVIGLLLSVTACVLGTLGNQNALSVKLPDSVTILPSGQMGLGDPKPLCTLSVGGGSLTDKTVPVQISAHGGKAFYGVNRADGTPGLLVGYDNALPGCIFRSCNREDHLLLQVNQNITAIDIDPTGNVGIGGPPSFPLDVTGTARASLVLTTNGVVQTSETLTSSGVLSSQLDTILDTRSSMIQGRLPTGTKDQVKTVRLLQPSGQSATVNCDGGGSFLLNASNPCRTLRFNGQTWDTEMGSGPGWSSSFFPTTQLGSKLVGTGATGAAYQGDSVAISADGNTMAVGGGSDNSNIGAVWIFIRVGNTWIQQGSKLTGSGMSGAANFGASVALSADGNTLAVSGPEDTPNGATWIFVRSGGTWTQQGSKLVGLGAVTANQGYSLALSADGNTLAVGSTMDNSNTGAAWIFVRNGTTWSPQGSKLTVTGNTGAAGAGSGLALSADGNTLAVGGWGDNSNVGATWIFVRSGITWAQQGSKLVGAGATSAATQGSSVALSSDGNTLAVAGNGVSSVWIFVRSFGTWSAQGGALTALNNLGFQVTLSADGDTLVSSYGTSNTTTNVASVFFRSNGSWTLQKTLSTSDSIISTSQACHVALSASGNTLAVGSYNDSSLTGASWIFS